MTAQVRTTTLAKVGEELIILDQHEAHERILYEKLLKNIRGTPNDLPAPAVVQPPADLVPEVWNFEIELEALDFGIEPFVSGALRLHAAPEAVTDPEEAFLGALEALVGGEDLAKALACQGSTKFGESLTREEMISLLREWSTTEFKDLQILQIHRTPEFRFRAMLTDGAREMRFERVVAG